MTHWPQREKIAGENIFEERVGERVGERGAIIRTGDFIPSVLTLLQISVSSLSLIHTLALTSRSNNQYGSYKTYIPGGQIIYPYVVAGLSDVEINLCHIIHAHTQDEVCLSGKN